MANSAETEVEFVRTSGGSGLPEKITLRVSIKEGVPEVTGISFAGRNYGCYPSIPTAEEVSQEYPPFDPERLKSCADALNARPEIRLATEFFIRSLRKDEPLPEHLADVKKKGVWEWLGCNVDGMKEAMLLLKQYDRFTPKRILESEQGLVIFYGCGRRLFLLRTSSVFGESGTMIVEVFALHRRGKRDSAEKARNNALSVAKTVINSYREDLLLKEYFAGWSATENPTATTVDQKRDKFLYDYDELYIEIDLW